MQNTDTEPQPDQPVVPGDPRLRQWTLLLAAAMLLTGLAALWLLRTALADLEQLAQRDLPAAVNRTLRLVMGIAVLGSAGMVDAEVVPPLDDVCHGPDVRALIDVHLARQVVHTALGPLPATG